MVVEPIRTAFLSITKIGLVVSSSYGFLLLVVCYDFV